MIGLEDLLWGLKWGVIGFFLVCGYAYLFCSAVLMAKLIGRFITRKYR